MAEVQISESMNSCAKAFADAQRKRKEFEKELAFLEDAEAAAQEALRQRMEADDFKSFHIPGIGRFTMVVSSYPRAVGDKEACIRWFDEQGVDIAPRTIAKARLKEEFEARQEGSLPLPPETIAAVFREVTVRLTAAS